MKKSTLFFSALAALSIVSCSKDDEITLAPPSDGTTVTLNGGAGEASAANAVYVDLSTDKADTAVRTSWDLGFYSGTDFRVILNNTTAGAAKVLTATDLAAVGAADTIGVKLAISQMAPAATDYSFFDAVDGNLSNTVIPAVPATAADSKVIILNRGAGGAPSGTPARPWIKLKVTRNTSGGYTLQYGRITETTTFTTVELAKDAAYNFKFVSLSNGSIVNVEPKKTDWDFTWSYGVFETLNPPVTGVLVPYLYSDLITTNYLNGVTASAKVYTSGDVRNAAYTAFNTDSIKTSTFSASRWTIGSSWRVTSAGQAGTGGTGALTTRFYVIKDVAGNYYKVKFISMGVSDGGVRGKPVFEYKLIK